MSLLRTRGVCIACLLIPAISTAFGARMAIAQSTAKPHAAATTPSASAAVRIFLVAMLKQDAKTLHAVTVPVSDADFKYLVGGQPPPADVLKQSLTHFQTISIRVLKPGDTVPLPSGKMKTVTSADVNDDNALLLPDGAPMPISLHRVRGHWLVDPDPFIAGRKSAANKK